MDPAVRVDQMAMLAGRHTLDVTKWVYGTSMVDFLGEVDAAWALKRLAS